MNKSPIHNQNNTKIKMTNRKNQIFDQDNTINNNINNTNNKINNKMNNIVKVEENCELNCPSCNKNYVNKYTLERHMETACRRNDISQIVKMIKSLKNINPNTNDLNKIIEAVDELKNIINSTSETSLNNKPDISTSLNNKLPDISNISNNLTQIYNKSDSEIKNIIQGNNNMNNNNMNNNNIINSNNTNVIFNINVFGNENTSMINDKMTKEILQLLGKIEPLYPGSRTNFRFDRDNIIKTLLRIYEKIHCDESYPENHNIFISNQKTYKPFHIFIEDQWQRIGNMETFKKTIIQSQQALISLIDNLIECDAIEADIKDLCMYRKTLKQDIYALLHNDNHEDIQKLLKQIFMKTYQHRDLLLKTFNQTNIL